jgi:hypothetical protein
LLPWPRIHGLATHYQGIRRRELQDEFAVALLSASLMHQTSNTHCLRYSPMIGLIRECQWDPLPPFNPLEAFWIASATQDIPQNNCTYAPPSWKHSSGNCMRKDSAGQVNQIYEEQTCTENPAWQKPKTCYKRASKNQIQARAGLLCELAFGSCPHQRGTGN